MVWLWGPPAQGRWRLRARTIGLMALTLRFVMISKTFEAQMEWLIADTEISVLCWVAREVGNCRLVELKRWKACLTCSSFFLYERHRSPPPQE